VHSFRGGTGKSNLTANLAVMVACTGRRVGIIDTDIQSPGIHVLFGLAETGMHRSLNDFLWGKCAIEEAAYNVAAAVSKEASMQLPDLFLIPSSLKAGDIARILQEGYEVATLSDGFRELMDRLSLEYLFIDTHPGVNEETLLSIALSDKLLIVLRPDNQDFQGTAVTIELARRLRVQEMLLLINKVPSSMDAQALQQQIEKVYQLPIAGVFPLNMEMVQVASGGIFCLRYPTHPFTAELNSVAQQIIQ